MTVMVPFSFLKGRARELASIPEWLPWTLDGAASSNARARAPAWTARGQL